MQILFISFFTFLAGFIDSVAGGGGLISLPAYLSLGLPTHNAIACNKFSAACGTTFSTFNFSKNKALDWKVAIVSALASFLASAVGSNLALVISADVLKNIILIALPVVLVLLTIKDLKKIKRENTAEAEPTSSTTATTAPNNTITDDTQVEISKPVEKSFKTYFLAFVIGLIIGFYDGLIGPGTGTFAIIAYSVILKYNLVTASGNAKVLNLASNYASVVTFLLSGNVLFKIAIPCAATGILGNYLGSTLAIKKGAKFIKLLMVAVIILLFIKILVSGI